MRRRTGLACGRLVRPSVRRSHRTAVRAPPPAPDFLIQKEKQIQIIILIPFRNTLIIKTEYRTEGNNYNHPRNRCTEYTRQNAKLLLIGGGRRR